MNLSFHTHPEVNHDGVSVPINDVAIRLVPIGLVVCRHDQLTGLVWDKRRASRVWCGITGVGQEKGM